MLIQQLGRQDYVFVWQKMQDFTRQRGGAEDDQLWLVEHYPVYTQGQAGKAEHILNTGNIPVIQIDRGGQITYHGLGQAVIYPLLSLKAANIGIRRFVSLVEETTIALLQDYAVAAHARADAPGVYVSDGRKIASLGFKVSRGCSYHGIAINVAMDLSPFLGINPCGLSGMKMAQLSEFVPEIDVDSVHKKWAELFSARWR